jgi:hypothetical protein
MKRSDLHLWAAYYNHNRYDTPLKLLRQWLPRTLDAGCTVGIVEHTIGERPFELSKDDPNMQHVNLVQIRGHAQHEGIFQQYPLYNVGLGRDDGKYFCVEDPDIVHLKNDWVNDALHMLQSHRVGQSWTMAIDTCPKGNVTPNDWDNEVDRAFAAAWLAGEANVATEGPYAPPQSKALLPAKERRDWRAHTGYSNLFRAEVVRGLGRLPDFLIAGSSDFHLWHGFAGNLRQLIADNRKKGDYTEGYNRRLERLADRCDVVVERDIGCVDGTIQHLWHGSKKLRFYGGREDILREGKFDPDVDIDYDVYGLPYLCSKNFVLRDGLRRYNRRRNSDCIRVD